MPRVFYGEKMNEEFSKKYIMLFEQITQLCFENNVRDPFSYARGKEIYQSLKFDHNIAKTYSKEDATTKENIKVEYKSTIQKKIIATYNGISVQNTWEEQDTYLKEKKICCYAEHYFSRFDKSGKMVEAWKMSADDVYKLLLPKLKSEFEKLKNSSKTHKDPRLGAVLTTKEIQTYGTKLSVI